jgi:hypothetical protein
MPRRSYASRRLSLESLEVRCNPAALIPMADSLTEPAPLDQPALPDVPAYSLVLDPRVSSAPDKPVELNAFAGQTVRLRFAAVNNQEKLPVGVDEAWLAMGTGQDTIEQTRIAGHELGHTLGFRHEHTSPTSDAPNTGDVNSDGRDDIITGAGPGGGPHVKVFDGTSNGELLSFFAFEGFTGGVRVAAHDIDPVSPATYSSTVTGRVTGIAADPIDPGPLYSRPDLHGNIGINLSEFGSTGDDRHGATIAADDFRP